MKQKQFEAHYAALWSEIESLLNSSRAEAVALPALYRRLCHSLALSTQRGYSPALTDYLQRLVLDCHQRLYGTPLARPLVLRRMLLSELPQRVREEWRLLLLALIAFWGVGLACGLLVWLSPSWAYSIMDASELHKIRSMYAGASLQQGRGGSDGDFMMFGFYIWNNVSICFRTFAGGIFGGVPALISLLFNGMHIGVIGSVLSADAATRHNFWSFVITHSSVEISGLLLSGVAGMRLGLAILHPGRLSRRHALYAASQRMFPVLVGAAMLTLLAAFIEAFWSASAVPQAVRYAVGAVCWLLVIAFFAFAGRTPR